MNRREFIAAASAALTVGQIPNEQDAAQRALRDYHDCGGSFYFGTLECTPRYMTQNGLKELDRRLSVATKKLLEQHGNA